ncbi:MAG: MraY family glycosyltransferase, partial [Candidatus Limnocylindrales bacterium]
MPLLAVLVATPVAIRVAGWLDFHDSPASHKGHARPTPYLGGTALMAGFLVGAVALGSGFWRLGPIVGGALVLWVVGTLDDRRTVTPQLRVLAAIGAATLLFAGGLGWSIVDQPFVDYVLTVLWVVGLVNAFNLMDNMDGASSTIASLSALGAAVLAISLGDTVLGALALGLAGACLGFLPYNLARPSARIFLGDGGSMPMGFVVAAAIMALPLGGEAGWHRLLAAVLLAGLPILDTSLVMVSRHRAGISLLQGGTDHLTHRLRRRLSSARAVALVLAGMQALLCLIAFSVTQLGDLSVAFVWATLVVGAA